MMMNLRKHCFDGFKSIFIILLGKNCMPNDNRKVEKCLLTKFQFIQASNREAGHRWIELSLPGLPVIATKFSHTHEDIRDVLWGRIARQLRVRKAYLKEMINCTKSREDYYQQVRTDPFPPFN